MKNLTSFLIEAESVPEQPSRVADDIVTVFGRHNPPHMGHKLTLDRAHDIAGSIGEDTQADQSFYTSRSQDPKKNPLPFEMKLDFLKRMFPEHAEKWNPDASLKTVLSAPVDAHEKGYKNFHMVVGDDRKEAIENLLRKYNGELYNFDNIYTHSAGPRNDQVSDDPISELSASKLRGFAQKDDFEKFLTGMPNGKDFGEEDARRLFDALKMFMEKNEEWELDQRDHQDLIREFYRQGEFIEVGDWVESLTHGLRGQVHRCGANHVICVTEDNIMFKNFVYDVYRV